MNRWARRILLSILLGVPTTIALAWLCALFSEAWPSSQLITLCPRPLLSAPDGFGVGELYQPIQSNVPGLPSDIRNNLNQKYAGSFGIDALFATAHRSGGSVVGMGVTTGWPWRCLSGEEWQERVPSARMGRRQMVTAWQPIRTRMDGRHTTREWYILPLHPLWLGFLLDTLFFGLLLFLLPTGRELVRRRFGHCPVCGYDLQHRLIAGCPECGWNRRTEGSKGSEHQGTEGEST